MHPRRADFDTFVATSTDSLMRTAYLIVGDLQDAEDLVQETLLKVAGRWHRVRRMEHPVGYARRILVNRALDDAGRRTRRRRELTGEALPDRYENADEPQAHDELLTALAALPPRQRTAIVLRYFLDLPHVERGRWRWTGHKGCSGDRFQQRRRQRPGHRPELQPLAMNEIWFACRPCAEHG